MKKQNQKEMSIRKKICANKKHTNIRIVCWTNSCNSAMVTHARSLTAAIKVLKRASEFHPNWKLEFVSEPNGNPPYIDKLLP